MSNLSGLRILLCPLLGGRNSLCLVLLPRLSDVVCEGVVGVGRAQESLDRQKNRANLQGRRPVA